MVNKSEECLGSSHIFSSEDREMEIRSARIQHKTSKLQPC